jgi:pimeloyl-ACP methyl ester carboxylesterase
MQAAVDNPDLVLGIAAINCSLRLLHLRKRVNLPWYRNLAATVLQKLLENKVIGNFFFKQIAKPQVIKKILLQAYSRSEAVTDELIDLIFQPSQDMGAPEVFLAFTAYSQGPLPEDLLPLLSCPTILLWGTKDPWEPIALGQELAKFPTVEKFISLEGLGHCPQDEAPEIVNPILEQWILAKA